MFGFHFFEFYFDLAVVDVVGEEFLVGFGYVGYHL